MKAQPGPFELQTPRLRLIPLDPENLRLSLDNAGQMEANLGLKACTKPPPGEMKKAVEEMLAGVLQDPGSWLWYTQWQIVLQEENRIIGGLCFKGPADQHGDVEVGYGIDPAYRGHGYMVEALRASVEWALGQPGVASVVGETSKSNVASHLVLEKVGFVLHQTIGQSLWWSIGRT
jgi:ribosomal-protein-alanine N-acetyltransferase